MEQMIKDGPSSSSITTQNNNDYLNFRKEIGIMSKFLRKKNISKNYYFKF
jgi:hypothetical protein